MEVSLGGYAAENLFMDTTTSGVSSDLEKVGNIARAMVRNWGMGSFKFNVSDAYEKYHYGASDETNREIELEIKAIVDGCLNNVHNLLLTKRAELDRLAHALVERETLYYKDIAEILEPGRSADDIAKEIERLADRKLVGKPPVVNINEFGQWVVPTGGPASGPGSDPGEPGSSTNNKTPN